MRRSGIRIGLALGLVLTTLTGGDAPAATSLPSCGATDHVSPWSVSPSYGSSWDPGVWAPRIAGIGVANVRGFREDSRSYPAIGAAGMGVTGFLLWSPDGRFPVRDLSGWAEAVRTAVTRHPEVRQWEVWNEPPNFAADATPGDYARVVQVAYDTAKIADRSVQVGIAAKATSVKWLAETIGAGAAGHFDFVTLHPYERAAKVFAGWEAPYLAIVPQVRAMLAEVAPGQAAVPIQFTEVGSPAGDRPGQPADPRHDPADQASLLAKVLTLSVAQGVQRVSWYDPFDGDAAAGEAPFGLIALDGSTRPAFTAYRNLVATLGTHPQFAGVVQPEPGAWVAVFRCGAETRLVAWATRPVAPLRFEAPVTTQVASSAGTGTATSVALGDEPTLVRVTGDVDALSWSDRAAAARAAATSRRAQVRWTAEDGADGLSVDGVVPVEVAGRAAVRPSGSAVDFAVDQRFAPWRRSRVTVTAVVRALGGSPGFNLKYDAARPLAQLDGAGQRSTGTWSGIVAGEWRTLTWTLDDVQLSGLYGVNLRFDSDSPQYAGYALSSVTVQVR